MFSAEVSVIIPVFNRESFIGRALDSVLSQTFSDFEILVIDDGSTDSTAKIINTYTDPRVKYFYQANKGPGSARNKGLKKARGNYIAYLDSDDELLPEHLTEMVGFLKTHPEHEVAFCRHKAYHMDGREAWHPEADEFNRQMLANKKYTSYFGSLNIGNIVHKRSCIEKIGFFREDAYLEDWDFWVRLFETCSCQYIDRQLSRYYIHETNIFKTISLARTYKDFVLNYLKKNNHKLPYDDYLLDTTKVLIMFAGKDRAIIEDLLSDYKQLYPKDLCVPLAEAHYAFYFNNYKECQGLCEIILSRIDNHDTPMQKNIYLLAHYLIVASCIQQYDYAKVLAGFHNIKEIKTLQEHFLHINLKLLRYFGGMFFPIAIKLIQAYNTRK